MRQRYAESLDILNAPLTEGYGGQETRDWAQQTSVRTPAQVYPESRGLENTDRTELTVTRWRVHIPAGEPVDEASRLLWEGLLLEVEGEVELHKLRGRAHHLELTAKRTEYGGEA